MLCPDLGFGKLLRRIDVREPELKIERCGVRLGRIACGIDCHHGSHAEFRLYRRQDGLDPALCPHTGTPVPGGLSFQQAVYLLARIVASGRRIVGFDLNEVAPGPDGDEWDGNVGARLLYKMIGFALLSRKIF